MKIRTVRKYEAQTGRVPFVGLLAAESQKRKSHTLVHGCNVFSDTIRPVSRPIAYWTDADIWAYIHQRGLAYCPIYDMGYQRTACLFCGFGIQATEETRGTLIPHFIDDRADVCVADSSVLPP